MDERWSETDLPAVLARAVEPIFMLNERGRMVFANPALHELFQVPLGNRIGWRELEMGPLRPPIDLSVGGARQIDVQAAEGRWVQVVFHSLQDVHAGSIGVLGVVRPLAVPPAAPVSDANLFSRWERLRQEQRRRFGIDMVPARSAAGARLLHQLKIAAATDEPVLFVGETGVGKLTLAKVLHHQRNDGAWSVTLDAEALSPEQQQDFLFGESGAIAQSGPGRLIVRRAALLDVGVQESLAEAHETSDRKWRLIATEWDAPEQLLGDGRLAPSLFYILTRLTISVPPLRDRQQDIGDFAAFLLVRHAEERGDAAATPTAAAVAALERYEWPGNLRELAHLLTTAADKAAGGVLDVPQLSPRIVRGTAPPSRADLKRPVPLDQMLEQLERRMLRSAHATFRGNKTKAAEHLGLSRARFIRRWEQLKLDEEAPLPPPEADEEWVIETGHPGRR